MLKVLTLTDVSGHRFDAGAAGVGLPQAGLGRGPGAEQVFSSSGPSGCFTRTEPITMRHGIPVMIFKAP